MTFQDSTDLAATVALAGRSLAPEAQMPEAAGLAASRCITAKCKLKCKLKGSPRSVAMTANAMRGDAGAIRQNRSMLPSQALASQRDHILALAAARGANGVRVFGSVAKGTDHEGSDVDLLVNMRAATSLLHLVGLQLEIADVLGVKVDLCTERELDPALTQRVLAKARPL